MICATIRKQFVNVNEGEGARARGSPEPWVPCGGRVGYPWGTGAPKVHTYLPLTNALAYPKGIPTYLLSRYINFEKPPRFGPTVPAVAAVGAAAAAAAGEAFAKVQAHGLDAPCHRARFDLSSCALRLRDYNSPSL